MDKLTQLLDLCGMDENEFLEEYAYDSVVPGICMNPDCDATGDYEPDQDEGWCEVCQTGSIKSGLMLIGII